MDKPGNMQGFRVIPVKYSLKSTFLHYCYAKQHALREKTDEKPSERTLFMVNVPSYCTEESIKFLWRCCGPVERVYFHNKPNAGLPPSDESSIFRTVKPVTGIKVAYVVFKKADGLNKALNHPPTVPLLLTGGNHRIETGYNSWVAEYAESIVDVEEMDAEIESYMAKYDSEEAKKKARQMNESQEDDEGWTTVTKGGRHPGFARKENVTRKIQKLEEKKRSKKELRNFYSFQLRESKVKDLMALRKKFEDDKKKIASFRQSRKFKPF